MDKDLTPLGELLEAARTAQRPRLSQNAAAKKAGTSATTYRRVVTGVSRFGGQDIPFDGSPDTIARIAEVLHVTPEQLEQVGRADVADELRAILNAGGGPPPEKRRWSWGSGREAMDEAERLMDENERVLDEIREINEGVRRLDADARHMVADLIKWLARKSEDPSRHGDQSR